MAHTEGGFWNKWSHHLCGSLPVLLLLCLATALLHAVHLFDGVDGWFMRKTVESVVLGQHQAEGMELELPSPEKRIVVLEASTLMRVTELEHDGRGLDQATLDRIGGVRPIDREKMAEFLSRLASRFDQMKEDGQPLPTVVAIDVDITPLLQPQPLQVSKAVSDALTELRKNVHVVAIVLDRPTDTERRARNLFMVDDARCTRDSPKPGEKGLYYASSRVFFATHSYPLYFPQVCLCGISCLFKARFSDAGQGSKTPAQREAEQPCPCPGHDFPSVANLIHALTTEKERPEDNATLTRLCREASKAPVDGMIQEDRVAGRECLAGYEADCVYPIEDRYRLQRINWKLAGFGPIEPHLLAPESAASSDKGAVTLATLDSAVLSAGTVLVGIDGGARQDRFEGATVMTGLISGPQLHALQAASRNDPVTENYSVGLLVDFVVGLVFLALWFAASLGLDCAKRRFANARSLTNIVRVISPALLALGLGWLYVEWSAPWLLQHWNAWSNPAYVLLGLVVHAYVESSNRHEAHGGLPDFSFGLAMAWNRRPRGVDTVVPVLALLICAAGILALVFAVSSGWPAALVAGALIVGSGLTQRREV